MPFKGITTIQPFEMYAEKNIDMFYPYFKHYIDQQKLVLPLI